MSKSLALAFVILCSLILSACSPSKDPADAVDSKESTSTPFTIDGQPWPMKIGQPFPEVDFLGYGGMRWRMSQLKGRVVLVMTVDMGDSSSTTLAGAKEAGMFQITPTLSDKHSLEETIRQTYPGFSFENPRIVVVEIITRNRAGFFPNVEEVNKWTDHFRSARRGEVIVVGATGAMVGPESASAIPGMYLIDRQGITRFGFANNKRTPDTESTLYRMMMGLCDAAPKDLPSLSADETKQVADAYEKNKMTPLKAATGEKEESAFEPALLEYQKATYLNLLDGGAPGASRTIKKATVVVNATSRRLLGLPSATDIETVRTIAVQAAREGCVDPIFQLCHGDLFLESDWVAEAEAVARKALATVVDPKYPPIARFRVRQQLTEAILRGKDFSPGRMKEVNELAEQAIGDFASACAAPNIDPYTQEFLSNEIDLSFDKANPFFMHIWDLADAIQNQKGIDPWLRDIMLARCHLAEAARQRIGTKDSDSKSEEANDIAAHNKAARALLVRDWIKRPENPTAALELMNVVAATEPVAGESYRFWFDQVVKDRFDDRNAYSDMLKILRSGKGDNRDQLTAFGIEAVDSERFDTTVPFVLLEVVVGMAKEQVTNGQDPSIAYLMPGIKEAVPKLYDGYLAQPKLNDANRRSLAMDYSLILFQTGDVAAARAQFLKVKDKIPEQRFKLYSVDREKFEDAMK